ncbi:hypothetical protein [Undibacterium sp. TJN19]|uniref:hypothetical protein n=1 Tax=Undibacterium sp. TJN19 TaxID=3413055 RepID=UPI003BEF82E7
MTQTSVDIDSLQSDDQGVLDVPVSFNDDAEPVAGFKIVGKNSAQCQAVDREIEILAIKRAVIKKQKIDGKTDEGAGQLVDLHKENQTKRAIAVVVSIYGFKSGTTELTATPEVLKDIFSKRPTWLAKITAALEADEGFLPVSSTTS